MDLALRIVFCRILLYSCSVSLRASFSGSVLAVLSLQYNLSRSLIDFMMPEDIQGDPLCLCLLNLTVLIGRCSFMEFCNADEKMA